MTSLDRRREREDMVEQQIVRRGIRDPAVLDAMRAVPRERFVPDAQAADAYADRPLPIGGGQTISQPYIVALMTEAAGLTPDESRVLDVGTGSGYHAAVLAQIARHVWSIERLAELSAEAGRRLDALGITNITLITGDGAAGWPDGAPYDAILSAAAAPRPPTPLLEQLAEHGRLVLPLGDRHLQELTVVERTPGGLRTRTAGAVRFVPLVSPEAFEPG